MPTTSIMRRFEFDYGHRVLGHEGKCKYLHGHRGIAEIYIQADLDSIGRVIDFGAVKLLVGTWIDDNLDHNILLNSEDPLAKLWKETYNQEPSSQKFKLCLTVFNGKKPYIMSNGNPTAENIAEEIFHKAKHFIEYSNSNHILTVTHVTVWETPYCSATFRL